MSWCQEWKDAQPEPDGAPYLSSEATSMMSGMSREKPALDFVRCIEYAWSLYERTGDSTRNTGVRYPERVVNHPIPADVAAASPAFARRRLGRPSSSRVALGREGQVARKRRGNGNSLDLRSQAFPETLSRQGLQPQSTGMWRPCCGSRRACKFRTRFPEVEAGPAVGTNAYPLRSGRDGGPQNCGAVACCKCRVF